MAKGWVKGTPHKVVWQRLRLPISPSIVWYYSLWRQKDEFWNSLPASGLYDGVNTQRISDWWLYAASQALNTLG